MHSDFGLMILAAQGVLYIASETTSRKVPTTQCGTPSRNKKTAQTQASRAAFLLTTAALTTFAALATYSMRVQTCTASIKALGSESLMSRTPLKLRSLLFGPMSRHAIERLELNTSLAFQVEASGRSCCNGGRS